VGVVTGEPTPVRISSLALGTGDIDCVYHFALPELLAAVRANASKTSPTSPSIGQIAANVATGVNPWAADQRVCRVCQRWTLLGFSGGAALGFLSMFVIRCGSRRMSPSGM